MAGYVTKKMYISIHALREEGDGISSAPRAAKRHFYPRPPRGGRQGTGRHSPGLVGFLSTPSARRATFCPGVIANSIKYFYPRPPRGGRQMLAQAGRYWVFISIHALREEGDPKGVFPVQEYHNFYPRPPRGGRRLVFLAYVLGCLISIHALREEGDD